MDILEHLIERAGQTQESRPPEGLAPGFVRVDERSARELYRLAKRLAAELRYHYAQDGQLRSDLDWAPFFPGDALPSDRGGRTPPHLALFAAFLKLRRIPRAVMNDIPARHLEFFYRRVLGFAPREAKPDRAHLLLELKKNAPRVEIRPEHAFSAGKDERGAEILYAPLGSTVVNPARVERLQSTYLDPVGGTLRFAPVADSADGLGGAFDGEAKKWRAFGYGGLPAAPVGFALASPVLRMKEGVRRVMIELTLEGLTGELAGALEKRFQAFVTGPRRWLGPYGAVGFTRSGDRAAFDFTLGAADEPLEDYDPARHGQAFGTRLPVVQLLLSETPPHEYRLLQRLIVRSARVAVEVSGVKSLQLENDNGPVDPRRAFQPFGAQPMPGAKFMIGYPEAMAKDLERLTLELHWRGLPASFAEHYEDGYASAPKEEDFKARVALRDGAGHETPGKAVHRLFQPREDNVRRMELLAADLPTGAALTAWPARHIHALAIGGSRVLGVAARRELYKRPMFGVDAGPPVPRPGFITLQLEGDFRHAEYRAKLLQGKAPANEPYTPTVSEMALSYRAVSAEARIDAGEERAFTDAEVELFHVGAFGQRREHAWVREQLPFVPGKRVPLLPEYEEEGELLIGLAGITGGDSASLLFQVAEGTADPDVDPPAQVRWSVLCDNYWKPLGGREAVRDGTNHLLSTGIVHAVIPPEASGQNTFLPAGLVWLRAAVREQVHGVCALVRVAANAVEVKRRPGGTGTALPPGRITRLKTPLAAIKTVTQPFPSFGGASRESDAAFRTRVAERLRHRDRCLTAWDYERSVLEAFPELRKVKCIPHCAGAGEWLDPGHVAIVVVPDLRKREAFDPLQPRVDAGTLRRIHAHLASRTPMGIGLHPRNPRYQPVRLDFKAAFRPGYEFNFYAAELRREIIGHLSPWAHDPGHAIGFGGAIYKSQVLDFIEERPYVDYVTDFRMYHLRGGATDSEDVDEARASTPDAILVSDATHAIAPVPA